MLHYLAKDLNLANEHSPCMAMGQASELPYVAGRDVDISHSFTATQSDLAHCLETVCPPGYYAVAQIILITCIAGLFGLTS